MEWKKPTNFSTMKVLVACEFSGVVRDAFSALGWDAWSCDLLPTDQPGNHIQDDVLRWLSGKPKEIGVPNGEWCFGSGGKNDPGMPALDYHLVPDSSQPWDLMIAHPPCTYLCVSGMHWTTRGLRDPQKTVDAIAFAEALWDAPIPHIALENPVGVLSTRSRLGPYSQKIQPYNYGHDASKGTCLWLKRLPPLVPTHHIPPRLVNGKKRWANQTDSGQNKLTPSDTRSSERSITYVGIAQAMAEQWTRYLLAHCDSCGELVDNIVGCPDGSEICRDCFHAGAH